MAIVELGTSWREYPVQQVLAREAELAAFAGISRLSRIGGLAGLSLPIVQGTRPHAGLAITVSGGKGTTDDESRASALMEAVEFAAAEAHTADRLATVADIAQCGDAYISELALCSPPYGDTPIAWSQIFEYPTDAPMWVPSVAIALRDMPGPFLPNTNGLASGASRAEALLHGALELLERHLHSLALVQLCAPSLALSTIDDPFCRELLAALAAHHLHIEVKDIAGAGQIPCYYALLHHPAERDSALLNGGYGCHPSATIALRRALTEAVQSRAVTIAGGREDISESPRLTGSDFDELYQAFAYWHTPTPAPVPLRADFLPTGTPLIDALDALLSAARQADFHLGRFFYRALPAPDGIYVVRCVWEGAELFGQYPERLGPQLRAIYAEFSEAL